MGNNIKGITVEIGGNTGPLTSALKEPNKAAGDLQNELKEVNRQLKFDPKNVMLSGQKIDLLKQKSQALEEKQKTLKSAVQQAHEAFEKGDLGADKVRAVEREYEKVNSQLKDTKKDLIAAESASGTFTEKAKAKFSQLKDKIKDTFSAENIKTALGAVGAAVSTFLGKAISSASDLAEVQNVVDTAFGKSADKINGFAQSAAANYGLSELQAKKFSSTLGAMTKSMGLSSGATVDMSEKLTGLTGDMASFYNLDPEEAFEKIRSGISGETEPLKQLGINMSETNLQAYALSEGIKKPFSSMSQAEQTTLRYNYLMSVTKDAQGDFSKTSGSLANQQRILKQEMESVQANIGAALLPVITKLLQAVQKIIVPIANFVSKNPQLTAAILAVIAVVGTLVGGMQLLTTVTTFFGLAADASLAPILPVVLGVTAAVVGLSALAVVIVKNWGSISTFFVNLWNTIKGAFSGIGQWFTSKFSEAANGAKAAWNGAGNWFSGIGKSIQNAFNGTIDFIKNNWKSLALFLVNPIAGAVSLLYNNNPKFKAWADSLMKSIKSAFTSAWNSVVAFFTQSIPQFIASIGQWFQQLPYNIGYALGTGIQALINFGVSAQQWVSTQLPQIINGIVQWFQQLPGRIWTFLVQTVTNIGTWGTNMFNAAKTGVTNTINAIGTWFSQLPVRVWTFLAAVVTKIGQWISSMGTQAATGIPNLISRIGTWFSQLPGKIWNSLLTAIQNVKKWCANLISTAGTEIPKFVSSVVGFMQQLPNKMLDIGKNIVHGIWNGITGAAGWLWGKVTGWCNNLVKGFKDGLGIHSPSKLFADVIGKNLALGIGQGFSETMKPVTASMAAVIPDSFGDEGVQARTARATAINAAKKGKDAAAEQAQAATDTYKTGGQPVSLTLVTSDGQTLGRFMAPFVGKTLEFNAKDLVPARG